jgi:hypothetical protein
MPEPVAEASVERAALPALLAGLTTPRVFRGLVAEWPLVAAASRAPGEAMAQLAAFDGGLPMPAQIVPPEAKGRIFYDESLTGFNFRPERAPLSSVIDTLRRLQDDPAPPTVYVGSATLSTYLPGFEAQHPPPPGVPPEALASLWLGNRSRIAAHHDVPDNLACVAAGRRRFTLFPPEQVGNLYIGPLDVTPAGQAISLVDFAAPDLKRFPRFAEAMRHALVVELEPGDALFIPSLWWHHVEGLEPFNVLVNYWWRGVPEWMEPPMNALMLSLLAFRELPAHQRDAWQAMFRHYVFETDEDTTAHIPEHARRLLAPFDATRAGDLRERLKQRLKK